MNERTMETLFASVTYDKAFLFLGVFVTVCILVMLAIIMDLWDGVYTAKSTGERIYSHKLRKTMGKMSEYWRFIFIGFLVDCLVALFQFYILPFVAVLIGVGLILVEARSMFEHARRRKSKTAHLPDLLKQIISAKNTQEAKEILGNITEILNTNQSL